VNLHRSLLLLSLLSLLSVAACSSKEHRPQPAAEPALPKLERASQDDLALELQDADQRGTWFEVRHRWQGQTLRWTVTRHKLLCATAERCNVSAFPVRTGAPAGWLPTLKFAPGQFAALEARCGDRELCEITIEGKLERLAVSAEQPTNLELTGVKLVETPKLAAR
jgi:hypothetical protein